MVISTQPEILIPGDKTSEVDLKVQDGAEKAIEFTHNWGGQAKWI